MHFLQDCNHFDLHLTHSIHFFCDMYSTNALGPCSFGSVLRRRRPRSSIHPSCSSQATGICRCYPIAIWCSRRRYDAWPRPPPHDAWHGHAWGLSREPHDDDAPAAAQTHGDDDGCGGSPGLPRRLSPGRHDAHVSGYGHASRRRRCESLRGSSWRHAHGWIPRAASTAAYDDGHGRTPSHAAAAADAGLPEHAGCIRSSGHACPTANATPATV